MNVWRDLEAAREHQAALLREAEVGRMLRQNRLAGRAIGDRVRDRVLAWVVAGHRRLHEIDASLVSHEKVEA